MNKNWNDRADKDLFFTILSVKNIGVISGAEWTTIGNRMRSLGYGFTNEGCRQHFQGLRRAQNKAEPNSSSLDSQRKNDPTANPITRRPGPGRGRPRKATALVENAAEEQPQGTGSVSATEASDPPAMPTSATASEPSSMVLDGPTLVIGEQPAKRQRLDTDEEHQQTNDEAVLALAADGITGATDSYGHADYYGEA
ncbi:hypothetical protein F4777DRAFT_568647 [Nemania sp. FL0916]|nr:hypothetical protein F4777DRAFT_568647 [Nemania sp. FL0916]